MSAAEVRGEAGRSAGNAKLDVWDYFRLWVPYIVSARKSIVVDWTDFDREAMRRLR